MTGEATAETGQRRRLPRIAAALVGVTGFLLSLPLVLGFMGGLHPAFDAVSHFRLHLAAAVAVAGILLLPSRVWRMNGALMLVLAAFATLVTLWPAWQIEQAAKASEDPEAPAYRLMQINLRFNNPRPEAVLGTIARELPDLVAMEEVSQPWIERLSGSLLQEYPERLICPAGSYLGGIAFLSRHPLRHGPDACSSSNRFLAAAVDLDGSEIELVGLHLGWPWPFGQDRQVERLASRLAGTGDNALLAGDFNAAPWSRTVHGIAAGGGFTPGPWAGPTYLDRRLPGWLRPLIGLPIDHAMAKGTVRIDSVRRLGEVGSDHLPVLVAFHIEDDGQRQPGFDRSLALLLPSAEAQR